MQTRRTIVFGIATSVAFGGASQAATSITSVGGQIRGSNYKKFADIVANETDKIIYLKIWVEVGRKGARFGSSLEDNQLIMSEKYDGADTDQSEILINKGVRYEHGAHVVDGYYIVKGGGMHQGVLSYGLMPVDEAQVLLSGAKKKKPIFFK